MASSQEPMNTEQHGCNLVREITDAQSGLVDLNMFSDLLDLFTYFPQKEKTFDNLSSQQVQPIISPLQKTRRQSFGGQTGMHSTTKSLDLMEEIWTRL